MNHAEKFRSSLGFRYSWIQELSVIRTWSFSQLSLGWAAFILRLRKVSLASISFPACRPGARKELQELQDSRSGPGSQRPSVPEPAVESGEEVHRLFRPGSASRKEAVLLRKSRVDADQAGRGRPAREAPVDPGGAPGSPRGSLSSGPGALGTRRGIGLRMSAKGTGTRAHTAI